ncbi:MAG: lytic murein transglycosylase [Actinobacteria bacterium]|nr:lytic murein transglycosylase [Actinomycetota bacterium]
MLLVTTVALVLGLPLMALSTSSSDGPEHAAGEIPPRVLAAYRSVDGWCPGLRWQLLAGIGFVESGHGSANGANVAPDGGEVAPPIFGTTLDGSPGVARLPIGPWLGWFGLTGPWQQAVGPMQFLPATFTAWAVDQDGDSGANPHDIDDAAASAANYLCGGRGGTVVDERTALLRYNRDESYASKVLAYADQLEIFPSAGRPTTSAIE